MTIEGVGRMVVLSYEGNASLHDKITTCSGPFREICHDRSQFEALFFSYIN